MIYMSSYWKSFIFIIDVSTITERHCFVYFEVALIHFLGSTLPLRKARIIYQDWHKGGISAFNLRTWPKIIRLFCKLNGDVWLFPRPRDPQKKKEMVQVKGISRREDPIHWKYNKGAELWRATLECRLAIFNLQQWTVEDHQHWWRYRVNIAFQQTGIRQDRHHIGANKKRNEDNERKSNGARIGNKKAKRANKDGRRKAGGNRKASRNWWKEKKSKNIQYQQSRWTDNRRQDQRSH